MGLCSIGYNKNCRIVGNVSRPPLKQCSNQIIPVVYLIKCDPVRTFSIGFDVMINRCPEQDSWGGNAISELITADLIPRVCCQKSNSLWQSAVQSVIPANVDKFHRVVKRFISKFIRCKFLTSKHTSPSNNNMAAGFVGSCYATLALLFPGD